ncbi:MAG: hypothetical protein HXY20_13680 [Acidobacteria bacterium]|nr:hypothetical protein [Acidobacteriota bacterium]
MKLYRHAPIWSAAILVTLSSPSFSEVVQPPGSTSLFVCGTSMERNRDAHARARYDRSRLSQRNRASGGRILFAASTRELQRDVGDVAAIEDDGTLITEPNAFDLRQRSIRFEPVSSSAYRVVAGNAVFDPGGGDRVFLDDDDAVLTQLGFVFSFFGREYTSVYLNSDGNLTFGEFDTAHTARDLGRFSAGPPRIGPFFADLDPPSGRVAVRRDPDGVLFIWDSVPRFEPSGTLEYNSFSAKLFTSGSIEFSFGERVLAAQSVVGISPGFSTGGITAVNFSDSLPLSGAAGTIVEVFSNRFEVSESAVARKFFENHPDDFDHLTIFLGFDYDLGGNAYAYEINVKNEVRGIGLPVEDYSAEYGSNGRLRSLLNMGTLTGVGRYPDDPHQVFLGTNSTLGLMGHESGHRWLAFTPFQDGLQSSYAILGRDQAHWSFFFDSDGSVMEGNDIEDRGADLGIQRFKTVGATYTYSLLDRYIMGLVGNEEVPKTFLVTDTYGTLKQASSNPQVGIVFGGNRKEVDIESIIAANGKREPSVHASPKVFRQGFILLSRRGQPAQEDQIRKVQRIRDAWVRFFNEQTGGRGWVVTDLQPTAGTTSSRILFPYFQGDRDRYTGIALANWGATPVDIRFTAYDNSGSPLKTPAEIINPRVITIPPLSQIALLAEQIHGLSLEDVRNGWIDAGSTGSHVTGFFLDGDVSQTLLDGAVASDRVDTSLYFVRIGGAARFKTLVNVMNPASVPAELTLTLVDQSGRAISTVSRTLNPRGRLAEDLTAVFPGASALQGGGYIRLTSDQGVVAYESLDAGVSTLALPAQPSSTVSRLYSAQFASGRAGSIRYFSELNLINTASEERKLEITLVGNSGAPVIAPGNPASIRIPAGAQYLARGEILFGLTDAALADSLVEGSLVVSCDGPGVIGDVTFGDPSGLRFLASLPLETSPASHLVLSQVAQETAGGSKPYFTGLAIYNPNAAGVSVTVDVYSEKGEKTGSAALDLPSANRISKTLPQLVPAINEQVRGYIRLSSAGGPIVAFELFGDQTVDFLAAVPPQPISP